ncbi:MAG TPA: methyltransferase [Candidatus Binatia bacterium]|nr:methyltransferase [Candidatus Binatia bacterium]
MAKAEAARLHAAMMEIINSKLLSRSVCLVAELAIADHLRNGTEDVASLASKTGTNVDALYRVMRLLAASGIFVERPQRRFENNPSSEILRSDASGSLRHYARWMGSDFHWKMVTGLDYSVKTGKPSLQKDEPQKDPFEILAEDRIAHQIFNDAMSGLSAADGIAIVQAYDFSQFGSVIDVGGGHGTLAVMIARAAPGVRVRVFDLPGVIDGTKKRIEEERLNGRIEAISGDFFEQVPGPADLCVLKHIIHDWDDDLSRRILTNCRNVLEEGGRILVCEMLITTGPEGIPAKVFDIEMLLGPGGRERTELEFEDLFASAGLKLNRVIATPTPLRLLEAVIA